MLEMFLPSHRRRKIPEREYRILERRSRAAGFYLNPPLRNEAILLSIVGFSAVAGLVAWALSGDPRALPEAVVLVGAASAAGGALAAWRPSSRKPLFAGLEPAPLMLALVGAVFAGVLYTAGGAFGHRHGGLAFGYVSFFPFAHAVSSVLEGRSPLRSPPRTAAAPLLGLSLLFLLRPDVAPLAPRAAAAAALFTASGLLLYIAIDTRLFRRLGFRLPGIVRFYRDAVSGRGANIRPLVPGEEADLWVEALAFRRAKGGARDLKALLVGTSVHPGFMSPLEGSDMPRQVSHLLEDLGATVVVKSASTHEQDPMEDVSGEIGAAVRGLVGKMRFASGVSDPARAVQGRAVVTARCIDSVVMAVSTFAPHPTDDVDVRVHAEAEAAARELGLSLFFVDGHNSHGKGGTTLPGTDRARELVAAARVAFKAAASEPRRRLRLGVARRPFGALLLFETFPGGRRDLLVVLDENNMLPEARAKLLEVLSVPGVVPGDAMEFCTTDTHRTIDPHHVHNPVTPADIERRKGELREMLYEAERSLEEVEIGYGRQSIRTRVFGMKIMEMKAYWEEEARRILRLYLPWIGATYALAVAAFAL